MGGIGTHLANKVIRYFYANRHRANLDTIRVIDGDRYELSNYGRQDFDINMINQSKAETKVTELAVKFPDFTFVAIDEYIDDMNISHYIDDGDIVLVGVDCMHARKLIDDHVQNLQNAVLIIMGNEYTDGDFLTLVRQNGENLTKPASKYWEKQYSNPQGKPVSEMSCEELSELPSGAQLIFANDWAALAGAINLYQIMEKSEFFSKPLVPEDIPVNGAYFDFGDSDMKFRAFRS
jgi:molybdopterin/thiamine biosynthesis adenylyltransferase